VLFVIVMQCQADLTQVVTACDTPRCPARGPERRAARALRAFR